MPTYEYRCPNGHLFDYFFRKMSDAQPTWPCPTCGLAAERLMSAGAGLVFKGSGFYITDYGKDGKKQERAAAKGVAAKKEGAPASGNSKDGGTAAGGGSGDHGGATNSSQGTSDRGKDGGSDRGSGSPSNASSTAPSAPPTPKAKPTDSE